MARAVSISARIMARMAPKGNQANQAFARRPRVPLGESAQDAAAHAGSASKVHKFQAVNWRAACITAGVKHWNRVLDWAVIGALSLLIVAALVHAGGQLRAAGVETQALTEQRTDQR